MLRKISWWKRSPPRPRKVRAEIESDPKTRLIKGESPLNSPPLNILYQRLLPLIRDLPYFKWPTPIQTDSAQKNKSLRCDYHKDHRHETDQCRNLKFLVEKLIKAYQGRTPQEVPQGSRLGGGVGATHK